ncbi:hypothetical protein KQI69_09090 [Eubacterium sp. MSJ-13]|uniref:hypothetical protein n=1 Tax=Eubacterium sp. MSJ-13 TaxID=2841513 RepID=UPI001C10BE9D|nr:hypothetical protein [Eubacterium sp. MSJ-13]MBU5479359.1 hypothetical protein [Eubacterium sp. MSJ-13]
MNNIKAKSYIEFTKDGITEKFYEGDKVICRTVDKEYTGKITCVGEFKENEEAEPVTVICLDTSKSVWSYSSEIIKFYDIEFMCKDFFADTNIDNDMTGEELQKNTYIGLFVGMGYDREKVENTWDKANNLMKQFNIPFEKTVSCILYSLKYKCNLETPLRLICGIDITGLEKSLPKFEKEAAKCLSMALVGGLVYLLADKLEKELTK